MQNRGLMVLHRTDDGTIRLVQLHPNSEKRQPLLSVIRHEDNNIKLCVHGSIILQGHEAMAMTMQFKQVAHAHAQISQWKTYSTLQDSDTLKVLATQLTVRRMRRRRGLQSKAGVQTVVLIPRDTDVLFGLALGLAQDLALNIHG